MRQGSSWAITMTSARSKPSSSTFGLTDKALLRLAKIVHSADVRANRDADPIATGLEAIAVGYSLRFPDDLENLERQFDVYDALYAWRRLQVAREG